MNLEKYIDETPTVEEALKLYNLDGYDLMDLLSTANKVRAKYCTNKVSVTTLTNAKSGNCPEDCSFCAQSAKHQSKIEKYSLKDIDMIVEEFDKAITENETEIFCIVTATRRMINDSKDYARLVEIIAKLKQRNKNIKLCASIGMIDGAVAEGLKNAGVDVYNHNIQTAPSKYEELVATTHSIQQRLESLRLAKEAGIKICTGGIIGLGETPEDIIEMAFTLKTIGADIIPINSLIPIAGTKQSNSSEADITQVLKSIAIMRIINKTAHLKIGAGRETTMKDFMGLAFMSGANSLITGGYLTEGGRNTKDDLKFKEDIEKIWNLQTISN